MRPKAYGTLAAGLALLSLTLMLTPVATVLADPPSPPPLLVRIVNTFAQPALVRDVDNRHDLFQATHPFSITGGSGLVETICTVPAGKRLVIETVTVRVELPPGVAIGRIDLITRVAAQPGQTFSGNGFYALEASQLGTELNGRAVYAGTHPLRAYADPEQR